MIHLHTWTTPNGWKASIMLEECGLPYKVHPIDISRDDQFAPEFLAISPNNKIPAIIDDAAAGGPLSIFDSGAILTYLAETTGKFLPAAGAGRYKALEWLYWQVGGLGPMLGQLGFFAVRAPEKHPFSISRFRDEAIRLLNILDNRLQAERFLAGDEYSIADIATFPWVAGATTYMKEPLAEIIPKLSNVNRWFDEVGARPAVQRGMKIPDVTGASA